MRKLKLCTSSCGGSVAATFFAAPRMTRDIDIVLELTAARALPVADLFSKDFLADESSIAQAATEGMFNLIHIETSVKIDMIVRKNSPYRREEFRRRQMLELEGQTIAVVAPEDRILSKLAWARDSHSDLRLRDARQLLRALPALDRAYPQRWALDLGVHNLLLEVDV